MESILFKVILKKRELIKTGNYKSKKSLKKQDCSYQGKALNVPTAF